MLFYDIVPVNLFPVDVLKPETSISSLRYGITGLTELLNAHDLRLYLVATVNYGYFIANAENSACYRSCDDCSSSGNSENIANYKFCVSSISNSSLGCIVFLILPKLLFVTDRVDEKHLFYDPSVYFKRKEVAEKRLQSVVKFVKDDHICRSRLLLAYFGETESEACGKCDNCLKKENATVSRSEFQEIAEAIRRVRRECGDIRDIVIRLPQFNEEKVVRVARELIDRGELQL